jgi:nucleoside 2-deoxyribosyltransferase
MKIYIASSFQFTKAVKALSKSLEDRGHTITCKWWLKDYKVALDIADVDVWFSQPIIRTIYNRSMKAIEEADMLILVAPQVCSFNGGNIEVGMALAFHKPVVCLGWLKRSAMYEPVIRCHTMKDLNNVLLEFEKH